MKRNLMLILSLLPLVVFAEGSKGTKVAAYAIAAGVIFGIVVLYRAFKRKK